MSAPEEKTVDTKPGVPRVWAGRLVELGLGLAVFGWLGWLGLHPGPTVAAAPAAATKVEPRPPAARVRGPALLALPPAPALREWAWHRRPALVVPGDVVCCVPVRCEEPLSEPFDAGPGGLGVRVRGDPHQEFQVVRRHEVWRRDADAQDAAWERVHLVEPGTPFEWVDRRTGWLRRWEYKVVSVVQLDPDHPLARRRHPGHDHGREPSLEPTTFERVLPARRAEREVSVAAVLLHEAAGGAPRVDLRVSRWDPARREHVHRTFLAVGEGQGVGRPPRAGEGNVDFTTGATLARIVTTPGEQAVTLRWTDGTEETLPIPARPGR